MMPKTRSRKFAPIFSSRRFIVLGICNPFRIKFCTQRSPFKPCFWKCLSSVSLHMILHNLSRLPADRVWLVPEEDDIRPLAQCAGSAPYRCCSSQVLSRQSLVTRDQEHSLWGDRPWALVFSEGKKMFLVSEAEFPSSFSSPWGSLITLLPFSFQKYPVVREMRHFCTQDSSTCSTRKYTKLEANKQIKWSDIKHIRMIAWGVKRRRAGVVGGNGELGWEINKPRE